MQLMNELLGSSTEQSKGRVAMMPGMNLHKERVMSGSEFINFGVDDDALFGLDYANGMGSGAGDSFFDLQ